ncbi:MAG: B12-binding domain-containing protein, partial [Deltaproteobacteria bacterium]|nr:B12-binding domain-containing protein [Deltaproteobacteria bacterium]
MTIAQQYFDALMGGNREMMTTFVERDLNEGVPPLEILNNGLIPGMERVGQKFRAAEIYIPEVLMAARAMHAGLDLLRPKIAETGAKPAGKIVIGTVKGDLHDIGKN